MISFATVRTNQANVSPLKHLTFWAILLSIHFLANNATGQEDNPSPILDPNYIEYDIHEDEQTETSDPNLTESHANGEEYADQSEKSFWRKIWGKKARDAVLLGMWTLHLDGTGEFFGDGRNNDEGYLIGAQYYGITAGTFINSHDDRAWFLGPAREIYSHNFTENSRMDIGYRFGLLYGYGDDLPNVGGMSVFAAGVIGFSWKRVGVDIGLIPVGIITGSFRIDIDKLFTD